MAKRFTDSNKWDHAWFRKLATKMKCAWFYICDKCDHAGIWVADFEALAFNVNEKVSKEEFESTFQDKVKLVDQDKYFIESFILFQYGALNPNNQVHKSILLKLENIAPGQPLKINLKGLFIPKAGAKDKEEDKVKYKDKEEEEDKEKEKALLVAAITAYKQKYPGDYSEVSQ